jgi:hypothetical protein
MRGHVSGKRELLVLVGNMGHSRGCVFRYCTRGSAARSYANKVTSYDDEQWGALVGDAHKVEERKKHAHLTDVEWSAVDPFQKIKR